MTRLREIYSHVITNNDQIDLTQEVECMMMQYPNQVHTHPLLKIIEKCKTLKLLNQVHAQMATTGLTLHTYPLSKLLFISSTIAVSYSLAIFNQIRNPTVFLFNILISSLSDQNQHTHIAFGIYNRILIKNTLKPNNYTYPSLFKACCFQPWLAHGRVLHTHVLKFIEPPYDQFVRVSMINYYVCYGKLNYARCLFDEMTQPDLAAWNSILGAYARTGSVRYDGQKSEDEEVCLSLEVFDLFHQMQYSLVRPNELTLVALISACANLAALSEGMWAHVYVLKYNLKLNRYVGTSLIEMYSKCGYVDLAYQIFEILPHKDTFCYNAMIGGLAIHGHWNKALDLYTKMKSVGLVPDDVTFIVTMFACSHVGLVEEGCKIFESIEAAYNCKPTLEHYGCLVDLLGRAGRVKEAEDKLRKMPMKPTASLWRSLLGAARVHGNIEIGEIALNHLRELEPETSGSYVLLSNIYASIDRWDDVDKVRRLMKLQGVNKTPGKSL